MRAPTLLNAREGPAAEPGAQGDALTGVVERVLVYRPETGYTVIRLSTADHAMVVVVATMPLAEPGELLRAEGSWYDDRVWGRQFRAHSVQLEAPASEEGLIAYLSAGRIKGLGEVTAKRLVKRFGVGLGEVIENDPEALRGVSGVGRKLVERLQAAWREQRANRDLLVFLAGHGIGPGRAGRILEAYGVRAREQVMADPYRLAREVRGIGFRTADDIALKLGLPGDSPSRLGAALAEVMREAAGEGHAALAETEAVARLTELTGADAQAANEALLREAKLGRLVHEQAGEVAFAMLPELAAAETTIAKRLGEFRRGEPPWADLNEEAALAAAGAALGLALAPSQTEAIRLALRSRLLIITGGPGTGKTTLVRGILAALGDAELQVLLAAPTGRAARRLSDSTGEEARTLHRLLEAEPERGFRRNAGRPLEGDLLVVDEASMIDTVLMAALLNAMPPDAGLILVGDVDQLPSIGAGQVLADLIASGAVPTLRLTQVFRQAAESAIIRSAHRINQGVLPDFAHDAEQLSDFYGIRVEGPEDAEAKLLELVAERIPERFGLDPVTDVQVLSPVHRGRLGTRALNELLQARLNPAPEAMLLRGEQRWALGDKVMQLENDYEREVYNGDIGRITGVDVGEQALEITIDGRQLRYVGKDLDRLAIAYAVTVHKAQGSEYPAIVLPLVRQHGRMLRRNLLYTAITRARRLVVLLTEPEALARAVRNTEDARRTTLLRRRLQEMEWQT